jgi:hypothetical protein
MEKHISVASAKLQVMDKIVHSLQQALQTSKYFPTSSTIAVTAANHSLKQKEKRKQGEGKGSNTCESKLYRALQVISISILLTLLLK